MTTAGQREAWYKVFEELADGDTVTQINAIAKLVILERDLAVKDWESKHGIPPCPDCDERHKLSDCPKR